MTRRIVIVYHIRARAPKGRVGRVFYTVGNPGEAADKRNELERDGYRNVSMFPKKVRV